MNEVLLTKFFHVFEVRCTLCVYFTISLNDLTYFLKISNYLKSVKLSISKTLDK